MMASAQPLFKVGDRVRSFRGESAIITKVREVSTPGKSHRVEVEWTDKLKNPDKREYYEEVFTYDGDLSD